MNKNLFDSSLMITKEYDLRCFYTGLHA